MNLVDNNKIYSEISKEQNINQLEVEKAVKLYFKGITAKIGIDEPCVVIIPFLGKLSPNKTYLKKFKDETDCTG